MPVLSVPWLQKHQCLTVDQALELCRECRYHFTVDERLHDTVSHFIKATAHRIIQKGALAKPVGKMNRCNCLRPTKPKPNKSYIAFAVTEACQANSEAARIFTSYLYQLTKELRVFYLFVRISAGMYQKAVRVGGIAVFLLNGSA